MTEEELEYKRQIINDWLRAHQRGTRKVAVVGSKMAADLLEALAVPMSTGDAA